MGVSEGQKSRAPLILAIEDAAFREQLEAMLRDRGVVPALSGGPGTVFGATPGLLERAEPVLDTGENVVRLVQMVKDLCRSPFQSVGAIGVNCAVSREVFEGNQQLGFWLIDGHGAVFGLWLREGPWFERLPELLERCAKPSPDLADDDGDPQGFVSVLQKIRQEPLDASAWTQFGRRVLESDGIHYTRFLVAAAARSLEAQLLLARALTYMGEKERVVDVCQRALPLDARCAEAYSLLGDALYSLRRKVEARRAFEQVIEFAASEREAQWATNALDDWGR